MSNVRNRDGLRYPQDAGFASRTIWHERGPRRAQPLLVGTAIAVIRNPHAGRYEPDLMPFQAGLRDLGRQLAPES